MSIKISQLTSVSPFLSGSDLIPVSEDLGSSTYTSSKATISQLVQFVNVSGSFATASYARTASILLGTLATSSYALTASYAANASSTTASYSVSSSNSVSSSYAITSSFIQIAASSSYMTGSMQIDGVTGYYPRFFQSSLSATSSLFEDNTGLYAYKQIIGTASLAATASYALNGGGSIQSNLGTSTGSITLDFSSSPNAFTQLTGSALNFTSSNLAANRSYQLYMSGSTGNCTLNFPPGWRFLTYKPFMSTTNKISFLTLQSWGTTDGSVIASYLEEL